MEVHPSTVGFAHPPPQCVEGCDMSPGTGRPSCHEHRVFCSHMRQQAAEVGEQACRSCRGKGSRQVTPSAHASDCKRQNTQGAKKVPSNGTPTACANSCCSDSGSVAGNQQDIQQKVLCTFADPLLGATDSQPPTPDFPVEGGSAPPELHTHWIHQQATGSAYASVARTSHGLGHMEACSSASPGPSSHTVLNTNISKQPLLCLGPTAAVPAPTNSLTEVVTTPINQPAATDDHPAALLLQTCTSGKAIPAWRQRLMAKAMALCAPPSAQNSSLPAAVKRLQPLPGPSSPSPSPSLTRQCPIPSLCFDQQHAYPASPTTQQYAHPSPCPAQQDVPSTHVALAYPNVCGHHVMYSTASTVAEPGSIGCMPEMGAATAMKSLPTGAASRLGDQLQQMLAEMGPYHATRSMPGWVTSPNLMGLGGTGMKSSTPVYPSYHSEAGPPSGVTHSPTDVTPSATTCCTLPALASDVMPMASSPAGIAYNGTANCMQQQQHPSHSSTQQCVQQEKEKDDDDDEDEALRQELELLLNRQQQLQMQQELLTQAQLQVQLMLQLQSHMREQLELHMLSHAGTHMQSNPESHMQSHPESPVATHTQPQMESHSESHMEWRD